MYQFLIIAHYRVTMAHIGERISALIYIVRLEGNIAKKLSEDIQHSYIFQKAMVMKGYEYDAREGHFIQTDTKIHFIVSLIYNKSENRTSIFIQGNDEKVTDSQFDKIGRDIKEIVEDLATTYTPFTYNASNVYGTNTEGEEEASALAASHKPPKLNYKLASSHNVYVIIKDNKELVEKTKNINENAPRDFQISSEPEDIELFIKGLKKRLAAGHTFCGELPIEYVEHVIDKASILIAYLFKSPGSKKHELGGILFADYPKSEGKPFYIHLICANKSYKGVADYMMNLIKSMADDIPIVLHSVEGLPKYYKERHGFKTIKMGTFKRSLKGLTPMMFRKSRKNNKKNK
jgi:hypothetical protein